MKQFRMPRQVPDCSCSSAFTDIMLAMGQVFLFLVPAAKSNLI